MLDLALYLMDFPEPVAVSGTTYNLFTRLEEYTYTSMWGQPTPGGRKDVDDFAAALIRFADGRTLELNVSWALNVEQMNPESGLRLMGDKGGVALRGMDDAQIYTEEAGHLVDIRPHFASNDPALDEIEHFAECVEQGGTPLATAQQGRTVQAVLDAIYRSAEERREVKVAG
jgi:predicted dehydrogenase